MSYRQRFSCRCCGASALEPVLDLGRQPLANSYLTEPAELPVFPLELLVCRSCFHCQLSVVVEPELMFRHYLYVSGTSRTLRDHFAGLAREAQGWVNPRPRRVLDLACNDGTLLEAFGREGCAAWGIDPAENLVRVARDRGLDVARGYWPEARPPAGGPFDLITACNVLAHVDDPAAFLGAALDCLSEDGAVVVEFPYCRDMVLRSEWDRVYHEHLSYFLVRPFLRLAAGLGARVSHARRVPVHGGSLRLALRRGSAPHCEEALALAEAEKREGLHDLETYRRFARRVGENCARLRELVGALAASGRRVVGYGASAKGNTLLNHCPLPLEYIVDDNPLKHGHLTPGRQLPILPPGRLLEEGPGLGVLLLAWNFAREIVANLRAWRPGKGDAVIRYVPEVSWHPVDADLAPVG
jgi:novobiocin biosynthesis protein NovU/D-mycarose 3-C-methyltransferase